MTDTSDDFFPPAAAGLPAGTLEAAEIGANRLDAWARTSHGRNFLAHALVQLARTGWLRTEPGDGFEPMRDPEPAAPAAVEPPADQTTPSHRAGLRDRIAAAIWERTPEAEPSPNGLVMGNPHGIADAVLPPPTDRAAVRAAALREAADVAERVAIKRHEQHEIEREQGAYDVMTVLRRVADETAATATQARRGDQFEAWLKQQRDSFGWQGANDRRLFDTLDGILDRYRLHADTGTPLGEHLCEGRVVGDCECLEQPAAGARQADETASTRCTECGHPKSMHGEGEDPVTPGRCTACPDDDAWHDYQPTAGARQDGSAS